MTKFTLRALTARVPDLTASLAFADEDPDNTFRMARMRSFFTPAQAICRPYIPPGEKPERDVKNATNPVSCVSAKAVDTLHVRARFRRSAADQGLRKGPATLAGTGAVQWPAAIDLALARAHGAARVVFFDDSHALRPYIGAGVNYSNVL